MVISKHLPEQPYLLSYVADGEDQHMASESRSVTDTASLLVSKGLNVLINYSKGFKLGEFSESRNASVSVERRTGTLYQMTLEPVTLVLHLEHD